APAADKTFNRITVDGDTSTNDTLFLLASGLSEAPEQGTAGPLADAVDKIKNAMPRLLAGLSPEGLNDFARAIMTTDTVPKMRGVVVEDGGQPITVVGAAKGAGMIRPDLATMLCFVCTDAKASAETLSAILAPAADKTFNRITVDGDTSTNDTVLLLASGLSRAPEQGPDGPLAEAVEKVLHDLSLDMVRDGEGATKLVTIRVSGCTDNAQARLVADTVANSPLVKTAFFGEDPNWGRILAAAGRSGARFDPGAASIWFGNVQVVQNSRGLGLDAEKQAAEVMKKPEYEVRLDLGSGQGTAEAFTCDFSLDYVKINADYRS
ncbi:MAG: bifunctional glutamate N-acetyltransferase/amino-acid acetyltransferase ArgJ, partial [Deltaproteobacteria bacterium]|nr:bifunctional glutamate N-acetyltransferase/amino-acid acetyltransferase ArgJ [Deltaproteobacteria bacterium]